MVLRRPAATTDAVSGKGAKTTPMPDFAIWITEFGLAAYFYGRDIGRVRRVVEIFPDSFPDKAFREFPQKLSTTVVSDRSRAWGVVVSVLSL